MKPFALHLAAASVWLVQAAPVTAQVLPQPGPPQPQVIRQDPVFGPICAGPLGPGRCEDIQRYLMIESVAAQTFVQQVGQDPAAGPICAGPLGPGPCMA